MIVPSDLVTMEQLALTKWATTTANVLMEKLVCGATSMMPASATLVRVERNVKPLQLMASSFVHVNRDGTEMIANRTITNAMKVGDRPANMEVLVSTPLDRTAATVRLALMGRGAKLTSTSVSPIRASMTEPVWMRVEDSNAYVWTVTLGLVVRKILMNAGTNHVLMEEFARMEFTSFLAAVQMVSQDRLAP